MRPGLVLPLGSVLLLLVSSFPQGAGASSLRREGAPEFPAGEFSGTESAGGGVRLMLNGSAPGAWTRLGSGPPPRSGCALAFDSTRGLLVLFGGESGTEWFNDTWTYNIASGTWTEMRPADGPSGRSRTSMVYDSASGRMVLFGGYVPAAPSANDTWTYDVSNNTWTEPHPALSPPGRYAHALAYDSASGLTVLFGGKTGPEDNDTWTYESRTNTWKDRAPARAPPGRMSHTLSYDLSRGSTILFGGYSGGEMVNDTWSYNLTDNNWTRKGLSGGPDPRENQAMDYDQAGGVTVLFGGWSYDNPDKNDTWTYDAGKDRWTRRSPPLAPSARSWHRMVFCPGRGLLLFGGLQTYPDEFLGDLWAYDFGEFVRAGDYSSAPFDTGGEAYFGTLDWEASVPGNTSLRFQFRTADSLESLLFSNFAGPDGTPGSFYERSGQGIHSSHNGSRWMQYRAALSTGNARATPVLGGVTVRYNLMHSVKLVSPLGGERWAGRQTVSWVSADPDGDNLTFDLYLLDGSQSSVLALGQKTAGWQWDTASVWRATVRIKVVARDEDPFVPLSAVAVSGELRVQNNRAPSVHLSAPANGSRATTDLMLSWTGDDPDGDALTYSVYLADAPFNTSSLPFPRARTNDTSLGVSGLSPDGTYWWAVLPSDGLEAGRLSEVRQFAVSSSAGNRPPRFTSRPETAATAGREYVYIPAAEDDDHDPMEYALVAGPSGMALNLTTRKLGWTPGAALAGKNVTVVLKVTDGRGGAAEQNYSIQVARPAPRCHITAPADGELIHGVMNVTGNATKELSEIGRVELRLDGGSWVTVCGTYLWSHALDTGRLQSGEHRLEARAYDGESYSEVESIGFRVLNPEGGLTAEGFPACFVAVPVLALAIVAAIWAPGAWRRRPG